MDEGKEFIQNLNKFVIGGWFSNEYLKRLDKILTKKGGAMINIHRRSGVNTTRKRLEKLESEGLLKWANEKSPITRL